MRCKLLVVLGTFLVVVVMGLMPASAYWYSCPASGQVTCPTGCGPPRCTAHGIYAPHRGVDIANSSGPMVGAAFRGEVVLARHVDGYGETVMIKHQRSPTEPLRIGEIGEGEVFPASLTVERWTRYAHLASYSVSVGQSVIGNQDIGQMGMTAASAVHLHWEVRGTPDPKDALFWYHINLTRGQQVSRGQYVWVEDGP
ncbi:MAG: Murein DD-endopeptidase MepM [candidate division WS2 bacterium]|nr:Murein DD-endopeptidase MepM [Candidatus Psychracetigena formicireducens]